MLTLRQAVSSSMTSVPWWALLSLTLTAAEPVPSSIEYLGGVVVPGTATDLSGLTDTLELEHPHNRLGGFGSAIAATEVPDEYYVLPDRGPADGAVSYRVRVHRVRIARDDAGRIGFELLSTILLTGPEGQPLIGRSAAFAPKSTREPLRFDPEGLRVTPRGTLLIAEEYGPSLAEFAADGRWLRSFTIPAKFQVTTPGDEAEAELPPHNTAGRQTNRGFEGLALTPDGKTAWAIFQGPLLQDGALDAKRKRVGVNLRIVLFDVETGQPSGERLYQLDHPSHGVSEILALSNGSGIVLERDGKVGHEARFKRLIEIDLTVGDDITNLANLPTTAVPPGVKPVSKRVWIDLLDPQWGLASTMPEKSEGITLGPAFGVDQRLLLLTSDNDFQPEVPSRIDVFAVP